MSDRERPATAAILTLGCKLNIADSEVMARRLRDAGWNVTDRLTDAEAVIVNTCSVTHVADQKSRHLLRQARRVAPNATVALTGCLLETAKPEAIDALAADLVYRQPDQVALADRLIEIREVGNDPAVRGSTSSPRTEDGTVRPEPVEGRTHSGGPLKTRAFIAAQEGCNDVCAFCIIPRTRGRERSKSVEAVVAEAKLREDEGVKEVVITGTQLGAYGRDLSLTDGLHRLLSGLLAGTSVPRIRMSSVQPQDLSDDLIRLWQDPRLCRHFHLALQSGSQSVLQRMRRRYTASQYHDSVARLREAVPDVAITTDVIVGFPGESEAEFEESYAFCRETAFAAIHVFPYSQRSGTVAFKMPDQVPDQAKKQRVHRLIALSDSMAAAYRRKFIGDTMPVLWETRRDGTAWEGLTDTYIRVHAGSNDDLTNRITEAQLLEIDGGVIKGKVVL